jgi:hypothetical protein
MRLTTLLILALLLAACGSSEPMSVADAGARSGSVVVAGYLFVLDDGSVVLADAIAESFPPQPGGATIAVEGLDTSELELQQAPQDSELATVQWSEEQVTLRGTMADGTLTGAELER